MTTPKFNSIHPFKLSIPQSVLDDLQTRLRLTRWPDKEIVTDWSQGVPLATIQELCEYWQTEYDWRLCERLLNSYPQFTTTIDGVEIYFLHIRSKHENALPMVLTHDWPGSILESRHVIDKLVDPETYGGLPDDAFHLVIPALPGYAFSGKPMETGWDYNCTAGAWAELMQRLGYADREWVAQGGDWGGFRGRESGLSSTEGTKERAHELGLLRAKSKAMPFQIQTPCQDKKGEEKAMHFDRIRDTTHCGYSLQMSTKPQTLGYGLADSPVAQAAWIYEKLRDWSSHNGDVEMVFSKDEILDTIMLYWLSNSATSSARYYYYWECGNDTTALQIDMPVGVSWFPGNTSYGSKEWCGRYYKNIVHWNELESGGHFAAWEVPHLFVAELRKWRSKLT